MMINWFVPFHRKNAKKSYSPYMEHRIILKDGVWGKIKTLKGWKTDADAARALNLTRSYISMITKAKAGCTATFMTRLAAAMGSTEGNWCSFFRMIPRGDFPTNHPSYNQLKFEGKTPYEKYSPMAELRRKDYDAEQQPSQKPATKKS